MKHAAAPGPFDDIAISLAEAPQRVEPGEYVARVIACRRQWRFGRELLVFQFRLVSPGLGFVTLPGYCALDVGGPRRRDISPRSKLGRWVKILREFDPSISTGCVPVSIFSRYEFVVQVVRPQRDYKRRPVAPPERRPTVQEILGVAGTCENAKKEKKKRLISSLLFSSHLCKVEPIDKMDEI